MDFPQDIWNTIMSYFHSTYKKSSHYECIMDVPEFYFIRKYHQNCYNYGLKWNKSFSVDSYYMKIILDNSLRSKYNHRNNKITLTRGVASTNIRDDFKKIFENYKSHCKTNILKNLKY